MDTIYSIGPNGELYHWGVKGMKWGVRRYQNKDGSLTPAGKKRRSEELTASEKERLDRPRRAGETLSKLSGRKNSEISDSDRGLFNSDVHTVLTQTYADRISSKNSSDVKNFSKFISDCWKYDMTITDAYVTSNDGKNRELVSERAKRYYNTYIKNDPDAYTKSVLEEIEYRELHHSAIEDDVFASDELYHHGTKGMRWGVRRYQNKDGSLTPAGRKRYADDEAELKAREKIIKNRERVKAKEAKLAAKKADLDAREEDLNGTKKSDDDAPAVKKSVKDMTDAELSKALARSRMEEEYKRLNPEPVQKKSLSKRVVDEVIVPAAINSGKRFLEDALTKAGKDLLKDKVDPNSVEALRKTAEKLRLTAEIDKLKNPDKYKSADDRTKEYDLERKKKRDAEEDAKAAQKAKDDAEAKAKKDADDSAKAEKERIKEQAKSDEYNKKYTEDWESPKDTTFRQKGGDREYTNPNEERGLTLYNKPVSNVTVAVRNAGRQYTETYDRWDDYVNVDNDPNYRPSNSTSQSTISLGQRIVAGLLSAPKDDD